MRTGNKILYELPALISGRKAVDVPSTRISNPGLTRTNKLPPGPPAAAAAKTIAAISALIGDDMIPRRRMHSAGRQARLRRPA